MANRRKHSAGRIVRRSVLAAAVVLALGAGAYRISPMLAQNEETAYTAFTVTQGTIRTSMSLSGTISVGASETISNQSASSYADMPTVRQVFVSESQRVKKSDKLLQLSNGDFYYAGIEGMVNEIRYGQGERVRAGATMMEICDIDHLIVTMNADEFDIEKIQRGQVCTITVLPLGISFETEVRHVNRLSNANGWVASYTVTADANAPDSVLPGMQASVTIPAAEAADVPVLPMEAIQFDGEGDPYVLVCTGGEDEAYEQRKITVGLSDGMNVQIVEGLQTGETVWAPIPARETDTTLSLGEIYKRIVGEKVVIIDRSASGARGGPNMQGMRMPEGMTPPEGMELPEGMTLPDGMGPSRGMTLSEEEGQSADAEEPEGTEQPESTEQPQDTERTEGTEPSGGMKFPEGMTPPEGMGPSGGMTLSEEEGQPADAEEPEGTEQPKSTEQPQDTEQTEGTEPSGGMKFPEGMTPPEGMELPEGMTLPEGMEPPQGMPGSGGRAATGEAAAYGEGNAAYRKERTGGTANAHE